MTKNILIIHTGGTLSMTGETTLEPADYAKKFIESLPEYKQLAKISSLTLSNLDSSDIDHEIWSKLAKTIAENRKKYDAFIILHGTDTMPYTASALAFALQGLDRPVILTGAQRPLSALRNDARRNLADAIELATKNDITEVAICFDGLLLRGCKSTKINTRSYRAFSSPGCEPLATMGVDIELHSHIRKPTLPFRCLPNFDPNVMILHITPGLLPELLKNCIESNKHILKGIVLVPFGVGTIPNKKNPLLPIIENTVQSGIDVLVANAAGGMINLDLYENSAILAKAGAIPGASMRLEAALVKLMHACALYTDPSERREYLLWNSAGELD